MSQNLFKRYPLAAAFAASFSTANLTAQETPYILTPKPRINGARIARMRLGHPFPFRIPATGERPVLEDPTLQGPARGARCRIVPKSRFPDIRGLQDHIHAPGLKVGIYSSPRPLTGSMTETERSTSTFTT